MLVDRQLMCDVITGHDHYHTLLGDVLILLEVVSRATETPGTKMTENFTNQGCVYIS